MIRKCNFWDHTPLYLALPIDRHNCFILTIFLVMYSKLIAEQFGTK